MATAIEAPQMQLLEVMHMAKQVRTKCATRVLSLGWMNHTVMIVQQSLSADH
jgi:hypothetical protein